jgi:hypothetical protein
VIGPPGKILTYLPGSINDLSSVFLALVLDDLAERILNGWIVAFNEMAVHKLHCERRFPLSNVSEGDLGDFGKGEVEWSQLTD